jgi:hypothetical protein
MSNCPTSSSYTTRLHFGRRRTKQTILSASLSAPGLYLFCSQHAAAGKASHRQALAGHLTFHAMRPHPWPVRANRSSRGQAGKSRHRATPCNSSDALFANWAGCRSGQASWINNYRQHSMKLRLARLKGRTMPPEGWKQIPSLANNEIAAQSHTQIVDAAMITGA